MIFKEKRILWGKITFSRAKEVAHLGEDVGAEGIGIACSRHEVE